jgi:ketosteroid isomerase-like protein
MKNLTRLLIVIVCVLLLMPVSAVRPVQAANTADTEFVKFLEDAWVNAIVNKNFDVLNLVIANDFVGVSPNGQQYNKDEAIADLKTGVYSVQSMKLDNVNVRIFGDTALVMFYQQEKSKFLDEDCSGRYAFTDVWVKRGGAWQVVASHGVLVTLP